MTGVGLRAADAPDGTVRLRLMARDSLRLKARTDSLLVPREFTFAPEDVRAIRAKLRKSQDEFALMIGVSVATLRNWEQGRRQPHGPARALLKVAAANPKAVAKALARH